MGPAFESLTSHVTEDGAAFLLRWLTALDHEYSEEHSKLSFIWHPDEERCRHAGVPGLRNLVLQVRRRQDRNAAYSCHVQRVTAEGVGWLYHFSEVAGQENFVVDDFVIVSIEDDQIGIFKGHIHTATPVIQNQRFLSVLVFCMDRMLSLSWQTCVCLQNGKTRSSGGESTSTSRPNQPTHSEATFSNSSHRRRHRSIHSESSSLI